MNALNWSLKRLLLNSPTFGALTELSNAANVCHTFAVIANGATIWVALTGRSSLKIETAFALLSAGLYWLIAFALLYGSLKIRSFSTEGVLLVCYRHAYIEITALVTMSTLFLVETWALLETISFDLSKLK
ncbi:hypothetical protein AAVH_07676 [Aphelenchoides avenae]|nr:hypothetical protein AAVH_07676 [Aphelenchus avenae]